MRVSSVPEVAPMARYLTLVLLLLFSCTTREDPAYQWLLGLAGNAAPAPQGSVPVSVNVSDVTGDTAFLFDTTRNIGVFVTVRDPVSVPTGTFVQIINTDGSGSEVMFQAVPDASGNVQGSFTVNDTTKQVTLKLVVAGVQYTWLIDIASVQEIRRNLFLEGQIAAGFIPDADADGIPDAEDHYPGDPNRSALIRLPADGVYTVAYEDLYPAPGDADFNDYAAQVRYEQDLNAKGELVRIRGYVRHVARGAGYRHTLHLNLPFQNAQLIYKRFAADGTAEYERNETLPDFSGVEIMPHSGTTLSGWNSRSTDVFSAGKFAEFEVIPSAPVSVGALGKLPYDLYLHVLNTTQNIHFAGRVQDASGQDRYLDPSGFPWAILVPGSFQWPYERVNMEDAYADFRTWYASGGAQAADWYARPTTGKVFTY